MTELWGLAIPLPTSIVGPIAVVLMALLGWTGGRIILYFVRRAVRRSPTPIDDAIVAALKPPLCLAAGLGGAWLSLRSLPHPAGLNPFINRGWIIATTLVLVLAGLRLVNGLTRDVVAKSDTLGGASGILQVIGRLVILSLGLLMILQSFGIAVEPLLASLGIGSLAIGLALKDTLSNLFAGIYLFADRPVRVGDFVRLESGQDGFVQSIGWRATRIRTLSNNMVVVPNGKLAEAIVTNFNLPEPDMGYVFMVSVAREADPERVMRILQETADAAAGEIVGLQANPAPFVQFNPGYGESSLDFSVIVRISSYVDQFRIQSELRRRMHARLSEEELEIPYRHWTVNVPELEHYVLEPRGNPTPSTGSSEAPTPIPHPPAAGPR
jgi:small-conductance mechanosensitive channel